MALTAKVVYMLVPLVAWLSYVDLNHTHVVVSCEFVLIKNFLHGISNSEINIFLVIA